SLAISAAPPNHGHGAIADVVVTIPSMNARLMPSLTAWHMPKSSPRTTSRISPGIITSAPSRARHNGHGAPGASGLAGKPGVGSDLIAEVGRDRAGLPPVHLHQPGFDQLRAVEEPGDLGVAAQRRRPG